MPKLKPDFYFEKITSLDEAFIKENNVKAIVLDVDNTLTTHGSQELAPDITEWLEKTKTLDVSLIILSNNSPERVKPFADKIGVNFLTGTKPKKSDYKRVLEHLNLPAENCVGVGDQIFTDVWGANASNLISVLTKPISTEHETAFIKLKRILEKPITRRFYK